MGIKAQPERKRDFIAIWEAQVHEDLRRDSMNLQKSWQIMKILHHLRDLRQLKSQTVDHQPMA